MLDRQNLWHATHQHIGKNIINATNALLALISHLAPPVDPLTNIMNDTLNPPADVGVYFFVSL
jgi:hypothetical protein